MISSLAARLRSLWRGLRRRSEVEAEMSEEFRLHLELRAADLVRSGLSRAEAERRARLEFGHAESYKQEGRESRGLRRFDNLRVSWLDFKLGFRMLARYPGLTLVGGFAFAFAIGVGAGFFEFLTQVVNPTLPLDQGDRIVALRNWDAAANQAEVTALHDFVMWREELESVEAPGAYRTLERNLIVEGGVGEPIEVAEISASAFRLARVPALLGRSLVEADEQPGAPPVVVIGYDVWQARFAGDSNVVGRTVRLGAAQATVVGVMPKGFALPISHSLWVPFRLNVADYERRQGPRIQVFGRLAPGATLDEAQAELTTLGQRAAADYPQTHQHLRPQVIPYAKSIMSGDLALYSLNLFVVVLLVLVCANVALLMFARAATRDSEIIVRTALGASRGRIVTQLFAEALVLGGIAAVVGLAAAGFGLRWGLGALETDIMDGGGRLPFWFRSSLSPVTVLYAAVLTLLGAAIAGVVPALKVTRGLQARLRAATAGGGGLKFGGVWTAVIVTQVAVTVAFPAVPYYLRRDAGEWTLDAGFPGSEYLSVRLELNRGESPGAAGDTSRTAFLARYGATSQELERRLMGEPVVSGVTVATVLPRMYHGWNQIEVDQGAFTPPDSIRGHRVGSVAVEADYFDVLGTPILSGRGFHSGDRGSAARVVIVNRPFVEQVLGGRNPIGRRVRYVRGEWAGWDREAGTWHEIVGVVRDIGTISGYGRAGIYHLLDRQAPYPVHLAIHVRGDPASFAPRLRAVAAAVDPTLRLYAVMPLNEVVNPEVRYLTFWFRLTVGASVIALLLSLAGVYAVMSFTVARRTREIGIRVALGGDGRQILASIFRRPLTQVGVGVMAGGVLTAALALVFVERLLRPSEVTAVIAYAMLMTGVCLLACVVPTRRALSVEPTEALRVE